MVSKQLLEELRMIIKEDYGVELQPQDLSEVGNSLVEYFELLIKIDQKTKDLEVKSDDKNKEVLNG